jgi:CO/xanthine dehydrogenase Mo-binding subunit
MWDVRAGIDANGRIVGYDNAVWAMSGTNTRETTQEIAGMGPLTNLGVAAGNSGPTAYAIANRRGVGKSVPVLNGGYLKTAPLRSPSSPNNFPAEQMIDELAHAADMDPIAFRILNSGSQRTTEALQSLAQIANWKPKVSASKLSSDRIVYGRGMALANPGGVVTDVPDGEPGALRGRPLHEDGGDEHRLGELPDPPLQGGAEGAHLRRATHGPALERLG